MVEQALFLGCGLVVFGLIFAMMGVIQLRIPLESLRWPAVDGEITETGTQSPAGEGDSANLRYRYTVQGKTYSGSRVSFQSRNPFQPGQSPAARYAQGSAVKVYYDPSRPDRSVLIPGAGLASYTLIALGGLVFVIGLITSMFAFI